MADLSYAYIVARIIEKAKRALPPTVAGLVCRRVVDEAKDAWTVGVRLWRNWIVASWLRSRCRRALARGCGICGGRYRCWPGEGWDRTRNEPVGCLHAVGIGNGGLFKPTGIDKVTNRVPLFGYEHRVVPDRGGTLHASHVVHRRIVVVARPNAHDVVRGVANGPVIAEILRGACLSGSGSHDATIAIVATILRFRVELQHIAIKKFRDAGGVVAQDVGHHIGQLRADDALALIDLMLVDDLVTGG